jgi:hypothetical protein
MYVHMWLRTFSLVLSNNTCTATNNIRRNDPLDLLILTEINTRSRTFILVRSRTLPVYKVEKITAICETIF